VLLEGRSRYVRYTRGTNLRGGRAPTAVALATVIIAAVELAALMEEESK
jgi:transcription initiation factor TFIIIB Brf1 subunit/transcription initiation factor TFIIB